jgi:hypothetical protein
MNAPQFCIVDTNVALAANGNSEQCSNKLAATCVDLLLQIKASGKIALDPADRIVSEYRNKLNPSGQQGVGNAFLVWVLRNQWNTEKCEMRNITCIDEDHQEFEEFPDHEDLQNFDISDRKFIAVANGGDVKPPILQAVDFKWWGWKDALAEAGIEVIFVDEDAARKGYEEHQRSS